VFGGVLRAIQLASWSKRSTTDVFATRRRAPVLVTLALDDRAVVAKLTHQSVVFA